MTATVTQDRGKAGYIPALNSRADEAFADFVCETRNVLLHAQRGNIAQLGVDSLGKAGVPLDPSPEGLTKVREVIRQVPELATYMRVKRTCQESYKDRIIESYFRRKDHYLQMIADAESRGPGSVTYDPDFVYPDYATAEIHIQPGGYTHPLAGLIYDYGTSIFFGGANAGDALHKGLVKATPAPEGRLATIVEIGCSLGQVACALKGRFPDARVVGTDISSAMVRYAHWRAVEREIDVDFAQMASEAMDFADGSVDLVVAHLLFHELPQLVIERTIAEMHRILRPGGIFMLWDFATSRGGALGYRGIHGIIDMADNGEPYAFEFVGCNVEAKLEAGGFDVSHIAAGQGALDGRVCMRRPD